MFFFTVSLSFPWHYCFPKTLFKVCLRSKRMEDWAMGWCSADSFLSLWKSFKKTVHDSATCGSCVLISYLPGWTKTKTNLWLELAMPASSTTVHAILVESRPTTSSWARRQGRQGGSKTGFGGLPGPPPFRSCVEVLVRLGVPVSGSVTIWIHNLQHIHIVIT